MKKKIEFIRVGNRNSSSYGGAQEWFEKKYMRQYGCGVIACGNVLFQLMCRQDGKNKASNLIEKKTYMALVNELSVKYLLVLPILGMNGIMMMLGMNLYFKRNKMPYRASWRCGRKKLWERVEQMLEQGIPVVLSVGPNFPNLWGKHRVKLYVKYGSVYRERTQTKAHYVTVTDMDEEWITISSWGNQYYIRKTEYQEYVAKQSNSLFSNILYIGG